MGIAIFAFIIAILAIGIVPKAILYIASIMIRHLDDDRNKNKILIWTAVFGLLVGAIRFYNISLDISENCASSLEHSRERERCLLTHALASGSPQSCVVAEGIKPYEADNCAGQYAKSTGDWSSCKVLPDQFFRSNCLKDYVKWTKDYTACQEMLEIHRGSAGCPDE